MPLYVYNITALPVTLVAGNGPAPSIPASLAPPAAGAPFDVTGCLRGLLSSDYIALAAQAAGALVYKWTEEAEYDTGPLRTTTTTTEGTVGVIPAAASFPYVKRYVRATGNDTTGDGLTVLTAYLTPQRAVQDCPQNLNGRMFRIDMTGYGTYVPATPLTLPTTLGGPFGWTCFSTEAEALLFGKYWRADVEIYAEPTLLLTIPQGTYTVVSDGTEASFIKVTVAGAAWTVDEWKDKLLVVRNTADTSGRAPCRVISNTADTLYLPLSSYIWGLVTTYNFRIYDESCAVDMTSSGWFLQGGSDYGTGTGYNITVAGLAFSGGYGYPDFGVVSKSMHIIGCKSWAAYTKAETFLASGCKIATVFAAYSLYAGMEYCTYADLGVHSNEKGRLNVYSCYGTGGDSIGEGYYHSETSIDSYAPRIVGVFFSIHRDTARGGVRLVGPRSMATIGYCDFTNCGYGAFRMEWGSRLYIEGPISGTGNGAGVGGQGGYILDDSSLYVAPYFVTPAQTNIDATNCNPTGASGDLIVGDNAVATWVDFFDRKAIADLTRSGARATQRGTKKALSLRVEVTAIKTANYAAALGDLVRYDPTGGTFVITLPSAVGCTGESVETKNVSDDDATAVTMATTGGQLIDGGAFSLVGARLRTKFTSDGANWMVG